MKTLPALLLCLLCHSVRAQMNYANISNSTITATLPATLQTSDSITIGPSSNMLWLVGWRTVNFIQSPTNGWAVDSYTISNTTNGYCSLLISTQHNIQIAQDAVWTNAANWLTISNEAHSYSNLTWLYSPGHNVTGLTNFVNTPQFVVSYYQNWVRTNVPAATVSNSVDFLNATWMLADIISAFGSSTNFPWRLIK